MIDNFVLIVGAMKCGTTSLFHYLAQHPQVSACPIKEPNFFANDLNWAKGFDWYQSLWDWNPLAHTVALEASTHYTKIPRFPNAAARIATIKRANFKIVYLMRSPLERIRSHYVHGHAVGWPTTRRPLSEGLDPELIAVSKYAMQIEEYYKRFSCDKVLLLMFEDLKDEPVQLLKNVCIFLEINPDFNFLKIDEVHNSNQGRRRHHPLWRSIKRLQLSRSVAKFVPDQYKSYIRNVISTPIKETPVLSEEQRNFVLTELKDDLQKLNLEYGVDINRWDIQI